MVRNFLCDHFAFQAVREKISVRYNGLPIFPHLAISDPRTPGESPYWFLDVADPKGEYE